MATRHWRAFLREKNEKKLFNLIFGSFYCTLYIINPLVIYNKNKCFVLELILSLAMGLFGTFFHYFNWGVSTKCFFHPDSETVWIFAALFEINLFSIIILGIIFQIILLIKNRKVKRI